MRPKLQSLILVGCLIAVAGGCASGRSPRFAGGRHSEQSVPGVRVAGATQHTPPENRDSNSTEVRTVAYEQAEEGGDLATSAEAESDLNGQSDLPAPEPQRLSLPGPELPIVALEQAALDRNPRLVRLYQDYQAAAARARYVDELPDPKLGATVFGNPIETASGSQRANMSLSQTIPWLGKLEAAERQACLEALALRAEYAAERLRVVAGVRVGWYRLYVIDKQIATTEANQSLLESLIEVANARIATGQATQGDVLLGTLELAQLQERLLTFRRQRRGVEAEINRLVARSTSTPIPSPPVINVGVPAMDATTIHHIALAAQPEIQAARLRRQATRWGVEVARLSRRPEFTFSASYFFTDNNRPSTPVVDVGQDPWALGVQVSLPIRREKYDAMRDEARWRHQASHSSVRDLDERYDALILDLVTEARRAAETAELYQSTILPQARQTLSADQDSYSNGSVEFDRVIRDYRSLLTLELGYEQAIGDLAIANARIQLAAGQDLEFAPIATPQSDP